MQLAVTTLEQVRGINNNLDRVRDKTQETAHIHQNNAQNLYTAGLDIQNLLNVVRTIQDQVQEINNNINESNNHVRTSLGIMTRDIQELDNTTTDQTNQIATYMKFYKGLTTESQFRMMMLIALAPSLPLVSGALGKNLVVEHNLQEGMLLLLGEENQHQAFWNQEDPTIESPVQKHTLDNLKRKGVAIRAEATVLPCQRKHRSNGPTCQDLSQV